MKVNSYKLNHQLEVKS